MFTYTSTLWNVVEQVTVWVVSLYQRKKEKKKKEFEESRIYSTQMSQKAEAFVPKRRR